MDDVTGTTLPSDRPTRRGRGRALAGLLTAAALSTAALTATTSTAAAGDATARLAAEPFKMATFNILGASHTEGGRGGMDTYEPRLRRTVRLLDRRAFSIVGLQEFQIPQYTLFKTLTGSTWGVYPGLEEGRRPVQNSIIWRTADWQRVEAHTYGIPYFYGRIVQQPYVKLRNREDGRELWVINTHQPSNSHGDAERWRDEAMAIEVALANRLEAETGVPVFLVGDFNEKQEAFCGVTGGSDLVSANPGSWPNGTCVPPREIRIDWLFHSDEARTTGYTALDTPKVQSITDHKVIFADVTLP